MPHITTHKLVTQCIAMTNTLPQSMVEVSGQTVHLRSSADIKMHQTLVQNLQKLTDFIHAPWAKAAVQQTGIQRGRRFRVLTQMIYCVTYHSLESLKH